MQIRSHAQKFFSKLEKEQAAGAKGAAHLFRTVLAQLQALHVQHISACLLLVDGEQALCSAASLAVWRPAAWKHIIWWGSLLGIALLILFTHLHILGCRPGRPEHPPSAPQAQALAPVSAQGVWAH